MNVHLSGGSEISTAAGADLRSSFGGYKMINLLRFS